MEKEIKVSVVCITYNQVKYIEQMLKSILSQKTDIAFEILVHDDASTDGTQEIIKKYEKKYPDLIKAILQKNNQYSLGISPQITYNYPRVKGKYIAYCEGDDYWSDPHKIQKQFDIMEKNERCSICVHKIQCISNVGNEINKEYPPVKLKGGIISSQRYMELELREVGWLFQTSSYFIRTKVVNDYVKSYKNIYPVGDLPLVLFALQRGDCYYLERKMSCYRVNSGGYMTNLKNRDQCISNCKKMIEGHKDFNKRSNYKYYKEFNYAILKREVELLELQYDYRHIFSRRYKIVRKDMSLKKYILWCVGAFSPHIVKLVERIRNGWKK